MSSGFQPNGFQGPPGFQQSTDQLAEIAQTLPALTQEATAFIITIIDLPSEVLAAAFIFPPPRVDFFVYARIAQTLPSLTQSVTVTVNDDELVLLLV